MQKIIICGNLTRDPVLAERKLKDGTVTKVVNFTVAVDDGYGDSKTTMYFDVHAWRGLAETCAKYLAKGREVTVMGPVRLNNYVSNNGNFRSSIAVRADEVQFHGKAPDGVMLKPGEFVNPDTGEIISDNDPITDELPI